MSETVIIPGLGERTVSDGLRYDYAVDKSRCANCGGLGIPWRGWFSCMKCRAVALVQAYDDWPAGQVFLPLAARGEEGK